MEYIHIKNIGKYHPGYKDRILQWGKIYINMADGDPDTELIENEIDWARLIKMILLELRAQKPLPNIEAYWTKKGFNLKKRPMSLTLQMLHNFVVVVTENSKLCTIDNIKKSNIKKSIEVVTENNNGSIEIYDYYAKTIKAGAREDSIKNIAKLLKTISKEDLIERINAYKTYLIKTPTESRYYIQANNFFGFKARYKDFEPVKIVQYKKADPNCKVCKGNGVVFIAPTSETRVCECRKMK